MAQIINLPPNIVSRDDREKLESFGGHLVAHGWAACWRWIEDADGDSIFELFHDGEVGELAVRIRRDRRRDAFYAHDAAGNLVAAGSLARVMAELELYFVQMDGGLPGSPA